MTTPASVLIATRAIVQFPRNPILLGFSFAPVLMMFLVFGALFEGVTHLPGFPTDNYYEYLAPTAILLTTVPGIGNAAVALAGDFQSRYVYKLLTAPISIGSIVLGRLIGDSVRLCAQAVAVLLLAVALGAHVETGVLGAGLMIVLGTLLGIVTFGVLTANLALRSKDAAAVQAILPMAYLLIFLTSAYQQPEQIDSPVMRAIIDANPAEHVLRPMRELMLSAMTGRPLGWRSPSSRPSAPSESRSRSATTVRSIASGDGFGEDAGVPASTGAAARLVGRDCAAAVELDFAAADEQVAELDARALHPGLHPGHRNADARRRLGLGQPLELGERDRVAVARAEPLDQWPQTRRQLAAEFFGGRVGCRLALEHHAGGSLAPDHRAPVVVGDGVACDLVNPGRDGSGVLKLADVAVDAQHHVLKDVLGAVGVGDPPGDEREQPDMEIAPHRHAVRPLRARWRAQRHPQPSVSGAPQQVIFASTVQHDACSATEQQSVGAIIGS